MESDTLQIEITRPEEKSGVESWMKKRLRSLPAEPSYDSFIFKVPDFFKEGNEQFYRPSVMSIGPFYYKDPDLETMQEVKWICLKNLIETSENPLFSLEGYIDMVREKEGKIRSCYEDEISLCSDEFVEMIVLDSAFLIQLIMSKTHRSKYFPSIADKLNRQMLLVLRRDIFVLENQLPFFILKEIFDMAFGSKYHKKDLSDFGIIEKEDSFISLSLKFMRHSGIVESRSIERIDFESEDMVASNVKHLVDLLWMSCCLIFTKLSYDELYDVSMYQDSIAHKVMAWILGFLCCGRCHLNKGMSFDSRLSYTAKRLKDSGVKFVRSERHNPLQITFAKGKLKIPKLRLSDSTEFILRNILAFEQCQPKEWRKFFTAYINFLDGLIDTVEDVQVLVRSKILYHHFGSDEDVLNIFNKIGKNVVASEIYYCKVSRRAYDYASTPWNRWMAILRGRYFNHPWVIISVIAASMLFVLTLLQTYASFAFK